MTAGTQSQTGSVRATNAIVLLADGTGNSSGALFKTNVWRLYQALDLNPASGSRQLAYYHYGVGYLCIQASRPTRGRLWMGAETQHPRAVYLPMPQL